MMDIINRYRDHANESSDEDSDDSDRECAVWKRAVKKEDENKVFRKIQVEEEVLNAPVEEKPKRKRNTVWSDILQDQLISEDLGSVLLKNKPAHYGSRGHESYDYTLKYAESNNNSESKNKKDSDSAMSEDNLSESDIKSEKAVPFHHNSIKMKKFVKLDSTERAAVQKINRVLNEKKVYLIYRVVKYVGIEKAIALLKMTEEIEENGGMMINTQSRRRTPGGVYLQLLRNDKDVTKEALDKIFEGELPCHELKKYYKEQRKLKKLFDKKKFGNKSKYYQNKQKMAVQEMESMDDTDIMIKDIDVKENMVVKEESILDNPTSVVPVLPIKNSDSELEDGEIED